MNKNNVIGWILIGAVMLGFMWYQSKQSEKQAAYQAYQDSIAAVEQYRLDSIYAATHPVDTSYLTGIELPEGNQAPIYKDSLLEQASSLEAELVWLDNGKLRLAVSTKGAQPSSAQVLDYSSYGGSDLYLFKEGQSEMGYSIYTGENINTKDFVFEVASRTDTSVVMRLPFANGGYIEQSYLLGRDSYDVENVLSFVGMDGIIPRNVTQFDFDWNVTIPRMEKGYKNESQYSKLNYYFTGDKKPLEMGRGRSNAKKIASNLEWFAFQQQFFSMIVRAPGQFSSGDLSVNFLGENADHNLMACNANMRLALNGGGDTRIPLEIYLGPNHYNTLKSYDHQFEKVIPLGGSLVGWFTKYFIIPMFNFLHKYIANFGLIILIMTLIIKIVVLPFTYKSFASSAKMSALRPYIEDINKKYPKQEDALKKQQATMELYKRAGVNAMGGCLPTLLTFPILWAMFRFFPASIELRQQRFLWAEDLSAYDSIVDFGVRVPLLGDHLSLFALLMAVVMWGYSKITMSQQPTSDDPSAKSMQFMSVWMMPIMMFFICNSLSSGLSYYYLVSQLISMVEIFIIRKWCVKPQAVIAKVEASKGKPLPKSKWQQRLEEAQKLQQQQMKQQQRKR